MNDGIDVPADRSRRSPDVLEGDWQCRAGDRVDGVRRTSRAHPPLRDPARGRGSWRRHVVRDRLSGMSRGVRHAGPNARRSGGQGRGESRRTPSTEAACASVARRLFKACTIPIALLPPNGAARPMRQPARASSDTISWDEARTTFVERILALRQAGRADHIAIVTPSLTGALDRLIESWSHAVGTERRLRYEPFAYEPIRAANRLSFGRDAIPRYEFATPHVLISFGADFLETWLSNVGYARDFAEMRRVRNGRKARFIQIEPRLSMTAASADEWLMAAPGTEGFVALAMVHVILSERRFKGIAPEEADAIFEVVRAYSPEAVCGPHRDPRPKNRRARHAVLRSDDWAWDQPRGRWRHRDVRCQCHGHAGGGESSELRIRQYRHDRRVRSRFERGPDEHLSGHARPHRRHERGPGSSC